MILQNGPGLLYALLVAMNANLRQAARSDPSTDFLGDGSDGAAVLDGTTTVAGMVPSGSVYTAAKDLNFTSLTINAGVTLNMAGFEGPFVQGTTTVAATGKISNNGGAGGNGSAGTGGTAGTAGATGSLLGGTAGGAGGSGAAAGSNGTNEAAGFPGGTGRGGAGGQASGGDLGGTAGTWTALAASKGTSRRLINLLSGGTFGASGFSQFGGGSGGGGGGGDNADAGGGGGGGGGGVLIMATNILVNNGKISADGGAGGNGVSTAHDAGGGGGGGGGTVVVYARQRSGTGSITAAGGAGGTAALGGTAGTAGSTGNVLTPGMSSYAHYDVTPNSTSIPTNPQAPVFASAIQVTAPTPTTLAQVVTAAENIRSVMLVMFADAPLTGQPHSGGAHVAADTTNAALISYATLSPLLPVTQSMKLPAQITGSGGTFAAVNSTHKLTLQFNTIQGPKQVSFSFAGTENTAALFAAAITAALPTDVTGGYAQVVGGQVQIVTNATTGAGQPVPSASVVSGDSDILASLGLTAGAAFTLVAAVTQPATQSQANALLNACQTALNAHLSQSVSGNQLHIVNDVVNTSTAATATDLGSSETLATNLTTCVNGHINNAAPTGLIHVLP